jgi:hypothetical protein
MSVTHFCVVSAEGNLNQTNFAYTGCPISSKLLPLEVQQESSLIDPVLLPEET